MTGSAMSPKPGERVLPSTAGHDDRSADASITKAGYRQQFARTLSRFGSFAVAFSFISITTGLFTTYGTVLGAGGPAGIWTWPLVAGGTL